MDERPSSRKRVLSVIACLAALIVLALILLPVLYRPPTVNSSRRCLTNLKIQGSAMLFYADEHSGHFPKAANWCNAVSPYCTRVLGPTSTKRAIEVLTCPALPEGEVGGYAFDSALSGAQLPKSNVSRTVMVFESKPGWNLYGGREIGIKQPRHLSGVGLLFVDGHARLMKESQTGSLLWKLSK